MILPRSDFVQTMTDSESNIMKAHGDYLQSLTEVGSIVCHGPVDDPKGGWGLSIFSAKDQTEVERLTAADPIILDDVGARYEILPMKQLRMKGTERRWSSLHARQRWAGSEFTAQSKSPRLLGIFQSLLGTFQTWLV